MFIPARMQIACVAFSGEKKEYLYDHPLVAGDGLQLATLADMYVCAFVLCDASCLLCQALDGSFLQNVGAGS
jgi:hypothetical protein